ncbi:MAG: hypothetical protein JF566_06830 [Bradyrhizobium sp.]|nr:hypothetical protein [Bradyrhizobium sp.]
MERRGFALRREGALRRFVTSRRWRLVVLLVAAVGLAGCASISEKFRDTAAALPGVGLPADAPERTAQPVAFPAVHDIPPPRNSVTLTNTEQDQMERELVKARDEQQIASGAKPKNKDAKAQGKTNTPVSSRSSIY